MALQNLTEFRWNKARNDAALLLAEDELTDTAIAEKVGTTRQTLHTWKQHPDFKARIAEHIAELEASVLRYAIAKKRNRVGRQNADWERLERIRELRADNPALGGVEGDETGLMIRQFKVIGTGHNAQTIEEYVVDTALVKARSDLEKQAAGEVGDDPPVKVRHGGDPDAPPMQHEVKTFGDLVDLIKRDAGRGASDPRPGG
jgi:hypothetical protein